LEVFFRVSLSEQAAIVILEADETPSHFSDANKSIATENMSPHFSAENHRATK